MLAAPKPQNSCKPSPLKVLCHNMVANTCVHVPLKIEEVQGTFLLFKAHQTPQTPPSSSCYKCNFICAKLLFMYREIMRTCITQRGGGERGDKATCRFSPFSHESIDVIRVQLGCLGDPWVAHNVLHGDPHRWLQQENPVKQVTQA